MAKQPLVLISMPWFHEIWKAIPICVGNRHHTFCRMAHSSKGRPSQSSRWLCSPRLFSLCVELGLPNFVVCWNRWLESPVPDVNQRRSSTDHRSATHEVLAHLLSLCLPAGAGAVQALRHLHPLIKWERARFFLVHFPKSNIWNRPCLTPCLTVWLPRIWEEKVRWWNLWKPWKIKHTKSKHCGQGLLFLWRTSRGEASQEQQAPVAPRLQIV